MKSDRDKRIENEISLLSDGLICIGESHHDKSARENLIELIKRGLVKKLFLEIPACNLTSQAFFESNETKIDAKTPQYVRDSISKIRSDTVIGDNSEIKWTDIIKTAKSFGVSVYFHDLPTAESFYKNKNDNKVICIYHEDINSYTINPNPYSVKIIEESKINVDSRFQLQIKTAHSSLLGVKIRNQYSAEIIKYYTKNLKDLSGTIIFGGKDHFNEIYKENALQVLCNIFDDERLFYFDNLNKNMNQEINKKVILSTDSFKPKSHAHTLLVIDDDQSLSNTENLNVSQHDNQVSNDSPSLLQINNLFISNTNVSDKSENESINFEVETNLVENEKIKKLDNTNKK